MDFDLIFNLGITILFQRITDPVKRAALKKVCIKIIQKIKLAYAGDPDVINL